MHADFFLLAAGRPPLPAAVVRRGVGRNGGTPAALRDDVTAHYAPLPAVASAEFIDIVTFRGLPTG